MLQPERAYGCTCLWPPPPAEALEEEDAVFAGLATAVTKVEGMPGTWAERSLKTRFHVLHVWKGPDDETIEVISGESEVSCGYEFTEGKAYIVYASYNDYAEGLTTGLCTRTNPLFWAIDDITALSDNQDTGRSQSSPDPEASKDCDLSAEPPHPKRPNPSTISQSLPFLNDVLSPSIIRSLIRSLLTFLLWL